MTSPMTGTGGHSGGEGYEGGGDRGGGTSDAPSWRSGDARQEEQPVALR